jgi:anti-sigma B factor antagonist
LNAASPIQAGLSGDTVWVRVPGRGSFQNSAGLKEFATEMTARGHREFVVDLQDCELMDSTFMGTLAGIALKLGPAGRLTVVRPNERCRSVLRNLGLDRVFTVSDELPAAPHGSSLREAPAQPTREAGRANIIEAHENLVAANPANAVRFRDVIEFLKQRAPDSVQRP